MPAVPVRRARAQDRREEGGRRRRHLARASATPTRRRPALGGRRAAGGGGRPRHAPVPVQPRPARVPRGRSRASTSAASASRSTRRPRSCPRSAPRSASSTSTSPSSTPGIDRARGRPRLPGLHRRPAAGRRRGGADAAGAGARLRARPRRDPRRRAPSARGCSTSTIRTTRPAPSSPTACSSAAVEFGARARRADRPRRVLHRDHLRRLRGAVVPRDARAPRRSASRSSRCRRATT